ncbi:MAG: hypothetical protein H6706_20040 [Myxococcales bacterium]|nr:hypothetical protein [Myxococcales bacterium]
MPRPFSNDLRVRVLAAIHGGMPWREASGVFGVSEASIGRWLRGARDRCTVEAKPMGGPNNVVMTDEVHRGDGFSVPLDWLQQVMERAAREVFSAAGTDG